MEYDEQEYYRHFILTYLMEAEMNANTQLVRLLKKGGLGLLQTIGKDAPSGTDPWISKYVFPGYYLPSLDEIVREMGRVGFSILDLENLRLHYARTLDLWAGNFGAMSSKCGACSATSLSM
jgi:cyclopropane fatty-acyl-phospholipid synthase-like methyltransferase